MHVGILTRTFDRPTLDATLDAVAAHGLTHVQFNLSCAGLPTLPDAIDPPACDRIARAMQERGLTMAAVSGTFNMIDRDRSRRRDGVRKLNRLIILCKRLGTSIITLCTGTRSPFGMWTWHEENDTLNAWNDLKDALLLPLEIADRLDVTLAIEPEVSNVIDSARKARRLLDEMGSPRLKVVIDAANLFHAGELPRMGEVLDEAFALLGRDIVLAHAKDLVRDGAAGDVAAGHGVLDYDRYLRLLRGSGYVGPLILHGLTEDQVPGCVRFLRAKLSSRP